MLKPQGYVTILSDAPLLERDTATCGHCGRIIFVKPGTLSTVYLLPQLHGPDREEPGASCYVCMRPVCLACHADGRCTPLERRIEQMEARGRFLKAVGVALVLLAMCAPSAYGQVIGGDILSGVAVTVTITVPTSSATYDAGTADTLATLSGTAVADRGLTGCSWTNSLGGSGSASGTSAWSVSNIALTVGSNVITVTCLHAGGTSGVDVITVTRAAASSCDRYVSTAGNNVNPGDSTSMPWRTIDFADTQATPGMDVCVCDDACDGSVGAGGVYSEIVTLSTSGNASNRITYKAYPGENPVVDGSSLTISADLMLVRFQASYITWDNIDVRDSQRNGIGVNSTSVTNLEILNSEIYNNGSVGGTQDGGIFFFLVGSQCMCRIAGNHVHDNRGRGIALDTNSGGRYLVEDNTSNDNLGCMNSDGIGVVDTPYVVVRRNTVHNNGGNTGCGGDTQLGDYIDVGGNLGCPGDNNHFLGENNVVYRTTNASLDETGIKWNNCSVTHIFRGNTACNVGSNYQNYEQPFTRVAWYHNTGIVSSGQNNYFIYSGNAGADYGQIHHKNNLLAGDDGGDVISFNPLGGSAKSDDNMRIGGSVFMFNSDWLWQATGIASPTYSNSASEFTRWLSDLGGTNAGNNVRTTQTLSQLVTTPTCGASFDATPASGSAAIDAGRGLVTASNSGSSSTALQVGGEGWYFMDGWGMQALGVEGDYIRIGSCTAVQISSINETTWHITLASPCTWSSGDPVYWSPDGVTFSGSAPDAGAVERSP